MRKGEQTVKCRSSTAIALVLLVLNGCNRRWSQSGVDMTTKRGNAIVAALHRFNAGNGHFPAELTELVPKYIRSIEPPEVGDREWVYVQKDHGKDFDISVKSREATDEPDYEHMEFNHDLEAWHMHRGF